MSLITQTEDLAAALKIYEEQEEEFVTIDTEFQRESTYWPQLCVVQIHGTHQTILIDALNKNLSLTPLFDFMKNDRILKVFHAARQDLEIFYQMMGEVPQAIFDTQIAAMVCGYGDQVGYETLVTHIVRQKLDKSQQFSNWVRRPLSDRQIEYAKADVIFLKNIYLHLKAQLKEKDRESWIKEEINELKSAALYHPEPDQMWRRLKLKSSSPHYLARLKMLAALREREAMRLNIPRGRILRDDVLTEIAHHNPQSKEDFLNIRGIGPSFEKSSLSKKILTLIAEANGLAKEDCPSLDQDQRGRKTPSIHMEFLRLFLKKCAERHGVAEKLIATTKDLDHLLTLEEKDHDHPLLHGWRYEVFGREAWALKEGEQGLYMTKRSIESASHPPMSSTLEEKR